MNPRTNAPAVVASALLPGDRIVRPSTRVPATVATVDRVDGVVIVTTVGGEPMVLPRGSQVSLRV